MILYEGECVVCETREEFAEAWKLLADNGYRWWSDSPLRGDVGVYLRHGFRWCYGHKFPSCIATLNASMAQCVCRNGKTEPDSVEGVYVVLTAEEFLRRAIGGAYATPIDDLL